MPKATSNFGDPLMRIFLRSKRPQQAPLFRQEAQPRLAVGGHTQVGLALMTVLDLQGAVPDRDGRLLLSLPVKVKW